MWLWADGKAINNKPIAKTSQVSLASQKGPIEAIMVSLSSFCESGSNIPTPKSKPSNMAYNNIEKPISATNITASELASNIIILLGIR